MHAAPLSRVITLARVTSSALCQSVEEALNKTLVTVDWSDEVVYWIAATLAARARGLRMPRGFLVDPIDWAGFARRCSSRSLFVQSQNPLPGIHLVSEIKRTSRSSV